LNICRAFVQEKGETPLKDEEVDELFSAVDTDGDKTTLTRDGQYQILCLFMLLVIKIGLIKRFFGNIYCRPPIVYAI
jgi:hypothetical protein